MPQYPPGFTADEYDELKEILLEIGQDGSFHANDLFGAYIDKRHADTGGTVEGYNARPVNARQHLADPG
jgi:hypothetical protein